MQSRMTGEERWALGGIVATFLVTAAWWALALWPVTDSPMWLERTRYVCFGVGESGLPDAGGWIGLIAGPLGMLGIVLVGWYGGVRTLFAHARRSVFITATLFVLFAGSALMIGGATLRVRQANAAELFADDGTPLPPSTYPRLDREAPELELIAHDGVTRSLASMRGRAVLLTFAYAHCTTICPVIVHDVLEAKKLTAGKPYEPIVLVVTLDPWRDTPTRLSTMARDWEFPVMGAWMLGGSVSDVESVLTAWDAPRSRSKTTGEVTHPSLVYIIDHDGRIAFASTGGSQTLAELLRRLGPNEGGR